MKKLLVVFAVAVLVLTLGALAVACGGGTTTTTAAAAATTTAAAPTTTAAAPSTTAAAPTTTAAATPTTAGAPSGDPIKIGHIVNLSGPEAFVGQEQEAALEVALNVVGNGIAGHPVQIIKEDAAGTSDGALAAAKKLVEQDKVTAILGPTEIGQKMAVNGYMQTANTPWIIYNPSPLDIAKGNKWLIASGGSENQPGTVMADYLFKDKGYKTIVTLTENNQGGHGFMDPLTTLFTADGGKVVKQYWAPEDTTDYSAYLTSLPKADCFVVWMTGDSAIALFNQCYQLKVYDQMAIMGAFHGGCTDPFVPIQMAQQNADAAKAMIGVSAPQMYAPDKANQDFLQGYFKASGGYAAEDDGASGPYQSLLLLKAALEATSWDATGDTLLSAILASKITGPEGDESFVAGSQVATKTYYILKLDAVPNVPNVYQYVTVKAYDSVPPEGFGGAAASTPPSS